MNTYANAYDPPEAPEAPKPHTPGNLGPRNHPMNLFTYEDAPDADAAVAAVSEAGDEARVDYVNGGTTVLDLMKLGVRQPAKLVSLKSAGLPAGVEETDAGVRVGAGARMSEVADHPLVAEAFPVIRESLLLAASPQIRNMASIGGNLLQRTRCGYFRHTQFRCNKREPGSGCDAIEGDNRLLAVLGTSEHCIASYPGDLAAALVALDATVLVRGSGGERTLPLRGLHRLPGDAPHLETVLEPGELILSVDVPASAAARHSTYVKARDRASYAFANASAAVGLELDGDTVKDVKIGLGGVATTPWHAAAAEEALRGRPATEPNFRAAADAALAEARPQAHNGFKVPLAKNVLVRALCVLADLPLDPT